MTGLERSCLGNGSNTQTYHHPRPAAIYPSVSRSKASSQMSSLLYKPWVRHAGPEVGFCKHVHFKFIGSWLHSNVNPVNPTGSNRVTPKGRTRFFLLSRCHWKHWNHIHDWTLDQNPVPCHEKGLGTLHGYVFGQTLHHYHHHGHVHQHDHHCASIPFVSHEVPW